MESNFRYFKRDISWLSFNHRVLLEAADESLPVSERINFISIYSSNLEEFYKVRVADQRAIASGIAQDDEESMQSAQHLVGEINEEVNRQLEVRIRIYEQSILPALERQGITFYQSQVVDPVHDDFIRSYFREEIFPYLQPVPVDKGQVVSFLRDNRLYLAIRLRKKGFPAHPYSHFVMKQPYAKIPRFVELPSIAGRRYIMFVEDIIKSNLDLIFTGYDIDSSYSIKISRDADILIDDTTSSPDALVRQLKEKVKKRKIGDVCRFVYDRSMPIDFLQTLMEAFGIQEDELVPGDKHLSLEDLRHFPSLPSTPGSEAIPRPRRLTRLNAQGSVFDYVARKDLLLFYPYHS